MSNYAITYLYLSLSFVVISFQRCSIDCKEESEEIMIGRMFWLTVHVSSGNDVVLIIFKEGNTPLDPRVIRSQFNRMYLCYLFAGVQRLLWLLLWLWPYCFVYCCQLQALHWKLINRLILVNRCVHSSAACSEQT